MPVIGAFRPLRRASRYLLGFCAGVAVAGAFAADRYPWNAAADRRCLRYALHYLLWCRDSCHGKLNERGEIIAAGVPPDDCCSGCNTVALDNLTAQCRFERFLREHDQFRHRAE